MKRILVCLFLFVIAAFGLAQTPDPVKWTGRLDVPNAQSGQGTEIRPGQRVNFVLEAAIESPWHVYSLDKVDDGPFPSAVEFTKSGAVAKVGSTKETATMKKFDPNFKKEVKFFEKSGAFWVPLVIDAKAHGSVTLEAKVTYQTCNEGSCLPPTTKTVTVVANISGDAILDTTPIDQALSGSGSVTSNAPLNDVDRAKQKGFWSFMLAAIIAGFASLVTPCVFPMIPITVSFFSKKKSTEHPFEGLKQALWYVGGIVFTFTGLGVAVAVIFGATGIQAFANNPYLNLALAAIFIALALSLFGMFELAIPASILSRFDGTQRAGFLGPVFMGLTFSLTSFTCTLPFVGSVLTSASQGDVVWPIAGMLAYSTAFAIPFFLLALFPQLMSRMPKSGAWLASTKAFMGFVELMAAVKFVSSVDLGIKTGGLGFVTREVYLSLWFGIAVLAGCYLLGFIKLPKVDESPKIGWFRRGVGVASLAGAVYFLFGINGLPLRDLEAFLPPDPYPGRVSKGSGAPENLTWLTNLEDAKILAKAKHKPIFVDFTGIYCTNCRWMERNMFPNPEVEKRMKEYILVRLFTDRPGNPDDKANQDLMRQLTNSVALPTYVTFDQNDKVNSTVYTPDTGTYVAFLDKALGAKTVAQR